MADITIIGINYAPEPTGIAPYTTGAAMGMMRRGKCVEIITGYPHYPQWRTLPGYTGSSMRERLDGLPVLRLRHPVPRAGNLLQRAVAEVTFGLRAAVSRWGKPAVVLTVSPALLSAAIVVLRAKVTRTPVVVWIQDIYTLAAAQTTDSPGFANRVLRLVESWTVRRADRAIVIHERFKRFVTQELGVDPERVDVVRNWSHVTEGVARSADTRRSLGWAENDTIVLHAGNLGAKQNLESVVRASRLAAERGLPIRFVLMGDGNRRAKLEAMGANANLQFIDPLPDTEFESALASADVLLVSELPGMTEMSVPSKLTSYFSTGLPVLAAVDRGSVTADELELSGGGVRVDPDDPAALLAAAQRLRADPTLAADLGRAGRQYREDAFNVSHALDKLSASLCKAVAHQAE